MKINQDFTLQKVGGSHVAVAVGETSKKFHGMIRLNETGAFLWKFFTEEHTVDEGVQALLNEYEVEETLARTDVETFVKTILDNGCAE